MSAELEAPVSGTFLKDSVSSFFTRVLVLGIGVAQAAVTARVLHPEGKGIFASAFMIPQLLITLAPLGIHWAATYHLGRGTFDRGVLIRSVFWALLLLGGISMLLCLGAGFLMKDTLLAGVPSSAFFLAVLTIPTQISLLLLDSLFLGEMRIPEANRLAAARGILLFICILILLLGLKWGVNGVILAHLISETCIIVVAVRRFGGVILRPISDWTVLRALLNYGLQIYSFAVLLYLNYRIGLFIVRYFLDLEKTGLFTTAVALAEMLWLVPHSLGRVLFPSIVHAEGAERNRLTLAVCRNTFWIMLMSLRQSRPAEPARDVDFLRKGISAGRAGPRGPAPGNSGHVPPGGFGNRSSGTRTPASRDARRERRPGGKRGVAISGGFRAWALSGRRWLPPSRIPSWRPWY